MADIGSLYFDVMLRDMTDADIEKIKKKLAKVGVKIQADVDKATLAQNIKNALKNRTFTVNVDTNTNIKKAAIEANKSVLTKSVSDALKGKTFSADLKLVVRNADVHDAIRQAFAKAGMQYNTTASDVRAARIQEIQQRMALRAANAQRNLGNAYRYSAQGAHESARASVVLGRSFHSNIRLAGELGTTIGNIASVFGIKDLLQGVVQIGGQLENQRIALGAILKDGGKATEMFSKIQSLAVKSPFGIMDLNQYTKQLSAYGIEYNELYETMKRMADISAGVGVDMGRIILAFGQVKAAGFLKGTELRQFTEANIPMVQALADKFSILEKRIVSAAEVYDMISKKKVTFQDVKDVLWDLTGEGGMFSGMQEVLSESLASKWKNLADAVDVMYGKIAEGLTGSALKGLAEMLTELTKGWRYVSAAITSATMSYFAYKLAVATSTGSQAKGILSAIAANHNLANSNLRVASTYRQLSAAEEGTLATKKAFTTAELKQAAVSGALTKEMALRLIATKKITVAQAGHLKNILAITRAEIAYAANASRTTIAIGVLKYAFISLGTAMKTLLMNPFTWVFAGVTAIMEVWFHFSQKSDEIKQRNEEISESAKGSISTLETELKKLDELEIGKLNDDEIKIKINELTTTIKNETNGWQSMLSDVFAKDADGNFVNSATKQLEMLEERMKWIIESKRYLLENPEITSNIIESTDGWFDESVVKNTKDYADAIGKVKNAVLDLSPYRDYVQHFISSTSDESIKKELTGKTLSEQLVILHKNKKAWAEFYDAISKGNNKKVPKILTDIMKIISKSEGEYDIMFEDIATGIDKLKQAMQLDGVTDYEHLNGKWRGIVIDIATKIVDEAGIQEPKLRQAILDIWFGAFNIKNDLGTVLPEIVVTPEKYDASKDEVAKMWKKRAEEIEKAVSLYDKWKEVEGTDKAQSRVSSKKELANLFNGKYGFNLDLEHPEEAYRTIISKLDLSKSAQHELAVKLGVKLDEATLEDAKSELKDFLEKSKQFIDDTTKKWDLYKELFKTTGNKSMSANIAFGGSISFKDQLEQIKAEIESEMKKSNVGVSFEDLIGMNNEELEKNGLARFKNLIEAYIKESAKLKEESVKNFINILNNSKDFAQQITDIEAKLQKDLADLRSNAGSMPQDQLKRREEELVRKAEEDKANVRFEEFKKSSDWVKVFDDLDRVSNATLDNMIKKVEEYARQANLSEKVTKQLVEAMGKLRDESIERNPFKGISDAWGRLKNLKQAKSNGVIRNGMYYVADSQGWNTPMNEKQLNDAIAAANEDLKDSALAVADKFQAVANAADLLSGLLENLGIDIGDFGSIFSGIASGAQTGAGISSAFGLAGPWGAVAGAALGMLSSVAAMHDKALQKEIEESEERTELLENISSNLESKLERTLGGIYKLGIDKKTRENLKDYIKEYELWKNVPYPFNKNYTSKESYEKAYEALNQDSYYDAQLANLMLQRDELKYRKELEKDKKKSDKAKLADYEQQIIEMEEEIKNFAIDMANTLYGIDFKDWANQLASALVDAWASGEDAVEAYKNTVKNILKDLGVSVISQKIIEPMLQDTMDDFIAQFEKDNGKLTDSSMKILAGMADGAEEAAKVTEAYLEGLKKLGIDVAETSDKAKDGLSKDIQGVTEDTANLLGSYLNAIRQSVHIKQGLLEKLIGDDIPEMSYIAQAQLQELNQIAANTKRNADAADKIYDLVNRVVDKGSNKLKV